MFFEIYINLQKEILKFRMKLINRILSVIFFISFIGMLIFNFSKEEFFEYYLFQKILFFFIFFLSFLGSFYIDEIEFSKKDSRIIFKRGILFLYKKKFYAFNDFQSLVIKKIAKKPSIINLNIKGKFVYIFGIKINDRIIIIENRMDEPKLKEFTDIFKSFFPKNVEIEEM